MARHVPKMTRFGLEVGLDKLNDDNGYVDIVRELDMRTGIRPAYISVSLIRQWAANLPQLRLVDAAKLEDVEDRLERAQNTAAELREQLAEAEAQLARINGIVRADKGLRIVKATGAAAHKDKVTR